MSKCHGIDVYYNGKLIIVGFSGVFSNIFTPAFNPVLLYSVVIQIVDKSKSR